MNKQQLCEAFCGELSVRDVPAGLAVKTAFQFKDGDSVGFYVVRHPTIPGKYRIEDSGLLIPFIESTGVSLETGTRSEAFARLLSEHNAQFDDDALELHSGYVDEQHLPHEAMRFVSLLLRVQDLELLHPDVVENTFKDDAKAAISARFASVAEVEFDAAPTEQLNEFTADVVIRPSSGRPVALYLGTRDSRVDEAVMLWMENRWQKAPAHVALLLEKEKPSTISGRSLRRAQNRLDATAVFRGDESAAMDRLARLAGLDAQSVH